MSTIVVVKKDGYATIGGDTLTMLGTSKESHEYIEDTSKVMKVGNNFFALVGHASWDLVLKNYFSNLKIIPKLRSRIEIFNFSKKLHTELKTKYFLNPHEEEEDPFESSQIDCLILNAYGIFGLYSLRSVQEYKKFYSFGSGYKFALGAMMAVYDTDKSSEEIAKIGIEAAAEFDDSTGLPLDLYTIKLKK